mgnify:CR=1 FL=1|tara:strand:- start:2450 stop:2602 length:153 start_codon:yes stop_codon:yes gene_type:complete
MPTVGKKKFPYTLAGKRDAEALAKETGKSVKKKEKGEKKKKKTKTKKRYA